MSTTACAGKRENGQRAKPTEFPHEKISERVRELLVLLLPMRGKCHVAYVPKRRIIGLSKIPRLVDLYARRLQVQERLTAQIADALMAHLKPQGVLIVTQAVHLCMIMRGVEKQCSHTTCAMARGIFQKHRDLELKVQGYLGLPFTPHSRR